MLFLFFTKKKDALSDEHTSFTKTSIMLLSTNMRTDRVSKGLLVPLPNVGEGRSLK
jgi:hypothetical protein